MGERSTVDLLLILGGPPLSRPSSRPRAERPSVKTDGVTTASLGGQVTVSEPRLTSSQTVGFLMDTTGPTKPRT